MKRKIVSGITLTLLLISMLTLAFNVQQVNADANGTITVVAIQPEFYYFYVNETNYRAYMTEMMEQAIVYQPDIIAFPEYVGFPLVGLHYPWVNDYINYTLDEVLSIEWNVIYYETADVAGTAYLNTFSTLAVEYGVHIIAGSICLPDGEITGTPGNYVYNKTGTADEVYNVAYFFDPNGYIIGTQKKVHLWESEWLFLKPSTEEALQVFDINIRGIRVGVGIAICYDAWFDSVGQMLVQRGADVLFELSWWCGAPSMDYNPLQLVIDSIWTRSQNQVVYGVLSCLVGKVFQDCRTGRSAITAPIQLTENRDGFINIADTFNSSTVVKGVLDIQKLRELRTDINRDEIVDIYDVVIVALAFGSYPGHPAWNPIADIRQDGLIDIFDLVIIGVNFGKRW